MKRTFSYFFFFAWMIVLTIHTQAASFDCSASNVTRDIDRFVCRDPVISALDEQMGTIYQENYRQLSPVNRATFLNSQRQWLSYWPQACLRTYDAKQGHYQSEEFAQCAKYEYERRIKELPIRVIHNHWKVFSVARYSHSTADMQAVPEWVKKVQHQLIYPQIELEGLSVDDQRRAQLINQWIVTQYKKVRGSQKTALNENDMDTFLWLKLEDSGSDVMSLESIYYFNSFGAHGNSALSHSHWSISKGRELMTSDILQGPWPSLVANEVYQGLLKNVPDMILINSPKEVLPSIQRIDHWNFYQEGLEFTFSPYEVAAYAAGIPSVLIPWIKLRAYLTEDAKSIISSMKKPYEH
jgi:uncharacterized protein YecT (DUF1311 family)